MPKLSVLVPVYNEAESLTELAARLSKALDDLGHSWEVVFANDGSSDGSAALLDQMAGREHRFKIVHLRRNFGQTAALMAAVDYSHGDVIVMMDADLQNDPADIAKLVGKLEEGYDVISGWRIDRREPAIARGSRDATRPSQASPRAGTADRRPRAPAPLRPRPSRRTGASSRRR